MQDADEAVAELAERGVVADAAGMKGLTTMKRHRHTPEQVVRKLREGERLLNEGKDLAGVLRHLEISEATWNRWRNQYGGIEADEARRPDGPRRRAGYDPEQLVTGDAGMLV